MELCEKFGLCWGLKQSPHITVKTPFDVDKLDQFISYIESLAKKIKPFDIELNGFNYFEPKVIFLDVKENSSLKDLHLRILKDINKKYKIKPSEFEGENIKFHSSVALEDVTEEKLEEAKKYLNKYKPKFKFKAKTLGIFYCLEDGSYIIIKRIDLKY
ncbi:2'-5' RNA ligase family protein [archaeon]|nr:2'-5' RNA ligase family protein [archaeon]